MPAPETKLSRLKPSFLSLSYEERMSLILTIRQNRRTKKPSAYSRAPSAKKKAENVGTKGNAKKLLSSLTPELAAELLAALGEPTE